MMKWVNKIVLGLILVGCNAALFAQQQAQTEKPQSPEVAAAAADPMFTVGEADVLRVNVWKEPELSGTVVVRPDGLISLPLVGDVKVTGLTPQKIQALLTDKLSAFVEKPNVSVSVAEIHSRVVYITGEISHPGSYPLLSHMSVVQLIAKAGGLGQFADTKGIFVLRNTDRGKQKLSFNYKDVMKGKASAQDIDLAPGDTVVVP